MSELSTQEKIDEVWKLFKETDARLDQRFQETDEQMRRLEGMFGIQWGRMLESLVEPAALQLFRERGIDVHSSHQRQKSRINGRHMELDIVLENDQDSVIIEVKNQMRVRDVDDFLDDLSQIHDFFSRFDGQRVYGAVAGLEFVEDADKYAYRRGLFVLGLSGEGLVRVHNDDRFQPVDHGRAEPS